MLGAGLVGFLIARTPHTTQDSGWLENRHMRRWWMASANLNVPQAGAERPPVVPRDVLAIRADDSRALVRDHDVKSMFHHNLIDKTGDTRDIRNASSRRGRHAGRAVARDQEAGQCQREQPAGDGDHGFIYQTMCWEDSDFVSSEPEEISTPTAALCSDAVWCDNSSFKTRQPDQPGLAGSSTRSRNPSTACLKGSPLRAYRRYPAGGGDSWSASTKRQIDVGRMQWN